ncbi:hypothetical protein A3860_11745 [Niastella vici]|uniref:DUF1223 domain-containing protein n=1 Tax=Niastella vici TaxID=1703345 RepID=A0A1V9FFS8_9BACT|nr:DUF1223 domain-containing protein [Niastella vici]OQP57223.1 hypothetical protein A3860_11745 [Niastella vici]
MNKLFILFTAIFFLTMRAGLQWLADKTMFQNAAVADTTRFAVIELFTSEGCSSCPPADELAARIGREFDQEVYVLAFHVDYWNYLGWKDAFSQPAFTSRQQKYGAHFKLNSIYTPQMIVNGKTELVGSNESLLRKTLKKELELSMTSVIHLSIDTIEKRNLTVAYKTERTENEILHIALVQRQAVTNVQRGENAGRQLHHVNIVRELKSVLLHGPASGTIRLTIPDRLSSNEVAVIAFTQDENSMAITGAGELAIK